MGFPQPVFRFGARAYDWMTAHAHWESNGARLADELPGGPIVILDLGCGPGNSTRALAAARPEARVVGLDLELPMLRRAQALDRRGLAWIAGDALRLPIRSVAVDAITGHSFLYLLPDRPRALAEMRRVLKPGGQLALLEPSQQRLAADLRSVAATFESSGTKLAFTMAAWRVAARSSGAFSPETLQRTLAGAGFADVHIESTLHGLGYIARARNP